MVIKNAWPQAVGEAVRAAAENALLVVMRHRFIGRWQPSALRRPLLPVALSVYRRQRGTSDAPAEGASIFGGDIADFLEQVHPCPRPLSTPP